VDLRRHAFAIDDGAEGVRRLRGIDDDDFIGLVMCMRRKVEVFLNEGREP